MPELICRGIKIKKKIALNTTDRQQLTSEMIQKTRESYLATCIINNYFCTLWGKKKKVLNSVVEFVTTRHEGINMIKDYQFYPSSFKQGA